MRFPGWLRCQNCKPFPEDKIHFKNLMYARHAPNHWEKRRKFPDVTQIRSDQSFNWSAFSIPVWTRFNNKKEYKENHGVCGYSVYTIRNAHLFNNNLPKNAYGVKHTPIETNFSHCELYSINVGRRNQKLKNAYRHALKVNAKPKIYPYQRVSKFTNCIEFFKMLKHQILVWFC